MCYTCKSPPQPVSFCMIARKRHNVKMEFYTCIAKYTFFGIRDEKLLASARKSWYHTMVCSGIEVVITGLTRNFWKLRPFRPLKMSTAQGFVRVRISQFHIVLACFSCILPNARLTFKDTWRGIEVVITGLTRNRGRYSVAS